VVPEQLYVDGAGASPVSDVCVLRLSNYPDGSETYVSSLTIVARSSSVASAHEVRSGRRLCVTTQRSPGSSSLRMESPVPGEGILYDIRGRACRSFDLAAGVQSRAVGASAAGVMLLRVGNGRRRHVTTYVNQ
jgi:hypothetical protein